MLSAVSPIRFTWSIGVAPRNICVVLPNSGVPENVMVPLAVTCVLAAAIRRTTSRQRSDSRGPRKPSFWISHAVRSGAIAMRVIRIPVGRQGGLRNLLRSQAGVRSGKQFPESQNTAELPAAPECVIVTRVRSGAKAAETGRRTSTSSAALFRSNLTAVLSIDLHRDLPAMFQQARAKVQPVISIREIGDEPPERPAHSSTGWTRRSSFRDPLSNCPGTPPGVRSSSTRLLPVPATGSTALRSGDRPVRDATENSLRSKSPGCKSADHVHRNFRTLVVGYRLTCPNPGVRRSRGPHCQRDGVIPPAENVAAAGDQSLSAGAVHGSIYAHAISVRTRARRDK